MLLLSRQVRSSDPHFSSQVRCPLEFLVNKQSACLHSELLTKTLFVYPRDPEFAFFHLQWNIYTDSFFETHMFTCKRSSLAHCWMVTTCRSMGKCQMTIRKLFHCVCVHEHIRKTPCGLSQKTPPIVLPVGKNTTEFKSKCVKWAHVT